MGTDIEHCCGIVLPEMPRGKFALEIHIRSGMISGIILEIPEHLEISALFQQEIQPPIVFLLEIRGDLNTLRGMREPEAYFGEYFIYGMHGAAPL